MAEAGKQGEVIFVGAGPGDPELITVKGLRALREADIVVYAGSLVNPALLEETGAHCRAHDSASLNLDEVLEILVGGARRGATVVRLHTGDPAVYGAIQEQIEALEAAGIPCRVVPGVTAAFAAAASLRQELTLPEVSQTVVLTRQEGRTPVPGTEKLRRIAAIGGTVCLYLSVSMMEEVVEELLAGGVFTSGTPAAVISKASWEDEQIVEGSLEDISDKVAASGIKRQALIIVGEALAARSRGVPQKSKLYDRDFAHGFRQKQGNS